MEIYPERGLKWLILLGDSKDKACEQVLKELEDNEVRFEFVETGPKQFGYGVELEIDASMREAFTKLKTKLDTPILIVNYVETANTKVEILQGECAIQRGLSKILSQITLIS